MRKRTSSRAAALCGAIVAVLSLAQLASGQEPNRAGAAQPRTTVQPLVTFGGDHTVIPRSGSTLTRTRDGVFMTMHASELTPGTVVTAWWVFFNNPKKCKTSPCTPDDLFNNPEAEGSLLPASGRLIGSDGSADYGAYIGVGDATGAVVGAGLTNPMKAEIHLVTRSHGPAMTDSAALHEQLTQFNGGCPPNTCGNLQASIHTAP